MEERTEAEAVELAEAVAEMSVELAGAVDRAVEAMRELAVGMRRLADLLEMQGKSEE